MFMGKPSVNRGKITSTDNTHPTSQNAKQIPDQHNAQNKRHIAKRFSARDAMTNTVLVSKVAVLH
jgi:hypothetical protein